MANTQHRQIHSVQLMAYFHCRTQTRIRIRIRIPVLCRIFPLVRIRSLTPWLVSTYVVCERRLCAQAGFWLNSKFWSKFSSLPLSGIEDQNTPPHFGKLQIWDDQRFSEIPPPNLENFRFWDDQSLLRNTPPNLENFRFGMTKVYSEILPPFWKTSDLGWPKFTPKYPPPPGKLQILGWPKFTPKYPPPIWKTSDLGDQSLLRNTPPQPKIVKEFLRFSEYRELLRDFIQPG